MEDQEQTTQPLTLSPLSLPQRSRERSRKESGSSTPVRLDATIVHWVFQDYQTSKWFSSEETSWRAISQQIALDPGFTVFQTRGTVEQLDIELEGSIVLTSLVAPQPVPFFSFERYAQPLHTIETAHWLYSVFGYALGDQVVCVRVRQGYILEHLLLARPVAFPW